MPWLIIPTLNMIVSAVIDSLAFAILAPNVRAKRRDQWRREGNVSVAVPSSRYRGAAPMSDNYLTLLRKARTELELAYKLAQKPKARKRAAALAYQAADKASEAGKLIDESAT